MKGLESPSSRHVILQADAWHGVQFLIVKNQSSVLAKPLMKLDYAGPKRLSKRLQGSLVVVMLVLIVLIASIMVTFLPIWPGTDFRGTIRTTYWNSDYHTTRN